MTCEVTCGVTCGVTREVTREVTCAWRWRIACVSSSVPLESLCLEDLIRVATMTCGVAGWACGPSRIVDPLARSHRFPFQKEAIPSFCLMTLHDFCSKQALKFCRHSLHSFQITDIASSRRGANFVRTQRPTNNLRNSNQSPAIIPSYIV